MGAQEMPMSHPPESPEVGGKMHTPSVQNQSLRNIHLLPASRKHVQNITLDIRKKEKRKKEKKKIQRYIYIYIYDTLSCTKTFNKKRKKERRKIHCYIADGNGAYILTPAR